MIQEVKIIDLSRTEIGILLENEASTHGTTLQPLKISKPVIDPTISGFQSNSSSNNTNQPIHFASSLSLWKFRHDGRKCVKSYFHSL